MDGDGQIRQGDVLLVPVDNVAPAAATTKVQVILAEGEITGHAHRLSAGAGVLEWTEGEDRFVQVLGAINGALSHEDHDPAPAAVVTPGQTFRVVPQNEWDLSGQWRQVVD